MMITNPKADSKTVFLVDEDPSALDLYRNRLEQAGFRTVWASDSKEASDALPDLSADLIILDLMLPKRGGFELLEAIRSHDRHKHTPVLILSNDYLPEMAQRALRAGGNKTLSRSECTSSQLIAVSRGLVGVTAGGPSPVGLAEQLKQDFLEAGPRELATIRQHCSRHAEVAGSVEGTKHLGTVYRIVRQLSTRAGLASCRKIAQLSSAIEALLFEQLSRSNGGMSPSSVQTLNQAVECLERLFTTRDAGSGGANGQASVLLVDDDQVCNMANEVALKRAHYDALCATNGSEALNLLNDQTFDLILLDIDMPGMNGIELCQRLRRLPQHQHTPVIFVTLHGHFENHAKTLMSGGDDLISKPISPLELIVKATVFLLGNSKLQSPQAVSSKGGSQAECPPGEPPGPGGRPKQVAAAAPLSGKFKYLREALAEETKRREAVERQAAENAKRRAGLEAAIEENQRSQEMFRKFLEECQPSAPASEPGGAGGQLNLAGRRRALQELDGFVADKLVQLKRALAEETKRREVVEQHVAENASRRMELEAALGESQRAEDAFQRELEKEENPKQLRELQSSLTESQRAREKLAVELEAARRELEARRSDRTTVESTAVPSQLEARIKEMQVAHDHAEQQVEQLKNALRVETERREAIKRQVEEHAQCRSQIEAALAENEQTEKALQREVEASESAKRWGELEAELAENKRTQAQLRQELAEAQKQLKALGEKRPGDPRSMLEARTKELQAAQAEVAQQVKRVTEALAEETRRREGAEQQAAVIGRQRVELEGELDHLRRQLNIALQQQQAQQESARAEQFIIEARTQELQAAQAAVEQQGQRVKELQESRISAEERIKNLEEAFAVETRRREAAERRVAQLTERQSELEAGLAEHHQERAQLQQELAQTQKQLEAQKESTSAQKANLEARTKELQAAQVEAEQRIQQVTQTLAEQIKRREGAEQQSAEMGQRHGELEAQLGQLRQALESTQHQLRMQRENSGTEQTRLEARTKELQVAQAGAEQEVRRLTETLAQESKRRENAEQQAGEIGQRRSELEAQLGQLGQQLAQAQEQLQAETHLRQQLQVAQKQLVQYLQMAESQQAQAQLHQQIEEAQRQLRVQKENYLAEQARLEAQTKQLQSAHASLEQQVKQLRQALTVETNHRECAGQPTGGTGQRRGELEADLAEKQPALAKLKEQLEQAQQQRQALEENYRAERAKLETRTKELQSAEAPVGEKIKSLTEALAMETKRREAVERLAVDAFKRRRELESQLAQQVAAEKKLQRELEAPDQGQPRSALEAELAENRQAQAKLRQDLAESQKQLQAQQEDYLTEPTRLAAETGALPSQSDGEAERSDLPANEAGQSAEPSSRSGRPGALDAVRGFVEGKLRLLIKGTAKATKGSASDRAQKEPPAQPGITSAEPSPLETRAQELQSAHAEVFGRVKRLTDSLAEESKRREAAEQQADEVGQSRRDLEAQLAQLRRELEAAHRDLQVQQDRSRAEQAKLEANWKELQAAEGAVAIRVQRLTEKLAEESKRREAAEQQAVEVDQRREQLEVQLTENQQTEANLQQELAAAQQRLQAQQASSSAQQTESEARIKELQSAQAEVENQVRRLTRSLTEETKRREGAEQQNGEVGKQRNQLEAELKATRQTQKHLRYELATAQEQLQAMKGTGTIPVVRTEEAAAAVERDSSTRLFVASPEAAEREMIPAAPLEPWRVVLHPAQRRLVEMCANGPVRVLGSAGTGKTVVAVHRAAWLARNACAPGQKILFTTATQNLAADIAASLQKLCSREEWERIEVVHLDAWAKRLLEAQGFPLLLTSEDASRESFWEEALGLIKEETNYPLEFVRGEWDNVIQAQGIEECDGYLTASRVGRARRLNRQERQQLWPVFAKYRALLAERRLREPADAFRAAARLIANRSLAFPYPAALVDDAQDFGYEAFRLIRAIVPAGENDLFIVGDAHQGIDGYQVVLSRCGIDIRGRGRKLRLNYRTTAGSKNLGIQQDC